MANRTMVMMGCLIGTAALGFVVVQRLSSTDQAAIVVALPPTRAAAPSISFSHEDASSKATLPQPDAAKPIIINIETRADGERLWHEALAMPDSPERNKRLEQIARLWSRQFPKAALQAIEQVTNLNLRIPLLYGSLRAWSERSPLAATEWAQSLSFSSERAAMLTMTLEALANQQPRAAIEIAEQLSIGEEVYLLPQLLQQWARRDLPAATAFLESVEDPYTRSKMLPSMLEIYADGNTDAALRWANTLPSSETQSVITNILSRVVTRDPAQARSLLDTFTDTSQRAISIYTVASVWTRSDPEAALAWVQQMPTTSARTGVNAIFASWASYDPATAAKRVGQLPDTALRDAATISMLSQSLEPNLIEELYARIENPNTRSETAATLYYRFRDSDPAMAERYREDGGIPETPSIQR